MWGFWFVDSKSFCVTKDKVWFFKLYISKPSQTLTVFATSVEIFDIVVETDSDGGEAHLSLQTGHQPVVQGLRPLCSDHGADGPKHTSVTDALHGLLLSLNLGSQFVLKSNTSLTEQIIEDLFATEVLLIYGWWSGQSWKSVCSVNSCQRHIHVNNTTAINIRENIVYDNGHFHCNSYWTDTWSLTLAVSRGNVTMSAIQAAAPALAIFTPSGGGTSEGFSPTMFTTTVKVCI